MTHKSELHKAALDYAHSGMAVFPCKMRGKTPITSDGFKSATTDAAVINRWWSKTPNANIGIATGERSGGLVVIDLDIDDDKGINGFESLQDWEREHKTSLPHTAQTITGRGGYHMLYRTEHTVKSRTGVIDGVDVRAEGGYIIAPPSVHPNGTEYTWEFEPSEVPIADANKDVLALVRHKSKDGTPYVGEDIIKAGGRNHNLFKYACSLQAINTSDDGVMVATKAYNDTTCSPPVDEDEVEKIVQSALKYPKGKTQRETGDTQYLTFIRAKPRANETEGRILQIVENAVIALEEHESISGIIRFNELTHSITVNGQLPWSDASEEREWKNADDSHLVSWMETKGITNRNATMDALVIIADRNKYHPVRDWLTALVWDGTERMDILPALYLGVDMSHYAVEVWRMFMYGAIARVLQPGIKFDYMPVLVGPQGRGKSMFVRRLCVPEHYFSDNFNTFEGDKAAEKLRGVWIAEVGELLALKRASDVESFKSFITSTVDVYRPPYGRRTERRARQAVLIGTTNDTGFLTDKTGNRRFLPLEIHPERVQKDDILTGAEQPEVTECMSQAWAEAYSKYKDNAPDLTLPQYVQDEALEMQKQYMEDDPRIGIIGAYLEYRGDFPTPYVCMKELAVEALKMPPDKNYVLRDLHNIMRTEYKEWVYVDKKKCGEYGVQRAYRKV